MALMANQESALLLRGRSTRRRSCRFGSILGIVFVLQACAPHASTRARHAEPHANCQGNFVVRSGAELQALSSCRALTGSLTLEGAGISSLIPLAQLQSVSETLEIRNNSELASLSGLDELDSTGGLVLKQLPNLVDARALSHLSRVRAIEIQNTPSLRSSQGFERIRHVHRLALEQTGFSRLLGFGSLSQASEVAIVNNPYLISVEPLKNLRSLRRLEVTGNRLLSGRPKEFFPNLTQVSSARIERNSSFTHAQLGRRFPPAAAQDATLLLAQNE